MICGIGRPEEGTVCTSFVVGPWVFMEWHHRSSVKPHWEGTTARAHLRAGACEGHRFGRSEVIGVRKDKKEKCTCERVRMKDCFVQSIQDIKPKRT